MTQFAQHWFAVYHGGVKPEGVCSHVTSETPWVHQKSQTCVLCGAKAEEINADRAAFVARQQGGA